MASNTINNGEFIKSKVFGESFLNIPSNLIEFHWFHICIMIYLHHRDFGYKNVNIFFFYIM